MICKFINAKIDPKFKLAQTLSDRHKKIMLFDAYEKLNQKSTADQMMELILNKLYLYSQKGETVNFAHEGNDYEEQSVSHDVPFENHRNLHTVN